MKTILIADDHPIVVNGIKHLLLQTGDYDIVGVACSANECAQMLKTLHPDVLVLDVGFPDGNALYKLPEWKEECPSVHILVVSCYGEPDVIRQAMDAGADGYVLKDSLTECILKGVSSVADGRVYLCPVAKQALENCPNAMHATLTQREREILTLIVEGLPMKQIASRLGLSFETVHSYTKYIRAKMGVNNTAALVRKALERRII